MKTYSQQDISNWLTIRSQVTAELSHQQQEKAHIERACQDNDDALRAYITDRITPAQTARNQIKAKIDILTLPEQIELLSKKITALDSTLSEQKHQHELLNNKLRPINSRINDSTLRLNTLEKDLAQEVELSARILTLENNRRDESLQLQALERDISRTRMELSTLEMHRHEHRHGHGHTHRRMDSAFGGFAHNYADVIQADRIPEKNRLLLDLQEQKNSLLRSTTDYELRKAKQQMSLVERSIRETTSGYDDLASLRRSLRREIELQNQESTPLTHEIAILSQNIQRCTQELTLQQSELEKNLAALERARRLVPTELASTNRDALEQALVSINASLRAAESDQIRLKGEKSALNFELSSSIGAIQSCQSHLLEMKKNHFLVSFTENPLSLFTSLSARIQEACQNYEHTHPYQQSIIVRQALTYIQNNLQEIQERTADQDPQWKVSLLHGFLWDIINWLKDNQELHLQQSLFSAFQEQALNEQESRAVFQAVSNVLRPGPDQETVHQNEALAYNTAIATFLHALDALPDNAPKEQQYFYKKGRALLNTIEQEVLLSRNKGDNTVDLKYHTKVLVLAHLSLASPENKEHANALLALTKKDTTGQSHLTQKIKGLVVLFLGAAMIATFVALPILISGPLFIASSALGICAGLAILTKGQALFADGCEKGLVKQGKVFENATKVSNLSMWAKPTPLAYATVVPPPPFSGEVPNYAKP